MPRPLSGLLILLDAKGRRHAASLEGDVAKVRGLGTFDVARLRSSVGRRIVVGDRAFLVLEPTPRDLRGSLEREAQTLVPKDLASLLFEADVVPGARVAEAGAGSGALTVALARSVGPSGRVFSFDLREDFLAVARSNVERLGLGGAVEFRVADVRTGMLETGLDAVFLDLPDPWAAVPAAWDALRPCGRLATFSPNMEQVKETVAAIRKKPFVDVRTIELIEREMEVREVGVRPSFAALGHTGYLTSATKVLDTF